jgi:DNA-binding response OmpR family regulator
MKILIIEDSRMLRIAIERSLSRAGYEVTSVGDGQQGLDVARHMNPDLILLDMMLPTLEGTGVLRKLRNAANTKLTPVIILSGLSQKNEERLKTAGATAYFEKSRLGLGSDSQALVQLIQELLACSTRVSPTY